MSQFDEEVMSSPKIHIKSPSEDLEEEYYRVNLEKEQSLVFQDQDIWQWGQHDKAHIPRSTTQGNPTHEENIRETDLGCEWANWNINKLAVRPVVKQEEQEELFVPGRPRRRTSRSVQKEPSSPTRRKKESRMSIHDKEQQERDRRRTMINRVLAGKSSFIWVFVLDFKVAEIELEPIYKLYRDHLDNDFVSPLCRSYQEAQRFFKMQNYFFKIITDVENSKKVIEQSVQNRSIISIYVYTSVRERGSQIFQLKRASKKIKRVFLTLTEAAIQVSQDLAEEARFMEDRGDLQRVFQPRFRFPAFMVLSGTDNSEVTAYRLCLYGALKLESPKEKQPYLKEFLEMVETRYSEDHIQLKNIQAYKKIEHLSVHNGQKSEAILRFYVKETFYYATVNCLLRMARSSEEFHPCALPFNETYHAIRYFYNLSRQEKKSFKAYRGCKLKLSEVNSLAKGSYIELLGFASSSLDKNIALKFMDGDSYLIQIIVDESGQGLSQEDELYQHGYVDINKFNLASDSFYSQQQILFNALNVYEVLSIDMTSAIRTITIKYGGLRDLKLKEKKELTKMERSVLGNIEFCVNSLRRIEDQGDLYLLSQEHEKAKEYYLQKLKEEKQEDPNIYGKLSHIYTQMGDLQKAELHALKMLSMLKQSTSLEGEHKATLIRNSQNASELLRTTENIEQYQQFVDIELKMIKGYLERSEALLNRSSSRMARGELKGCLDDLVQADFELNSKKQSFNRRKNVINRSYFFKSVCSWHNREAALALERQRDAELMSIEQEEIDFKAKEDIFYEYKVMIQKIKGEYYQKTGEIQKIKESDHNLRGYFKNIEEKDEDLYPLQAAKYYSFEAIAVEKKDFEQYELLMEDAIDIIKECDPYHSDIAKLSETLASERHSKLKRKLVYPQQSEWMNLVSSDQSNSSEKKRLKARFNYGEHKQFYKKCRNHFKQAINIIIVNKGKEHPDCLKVENKLAELDYDYSLLKQAEQEASEVVKRTVAEKHSEGAKSYLLLAKIALAKGELKRSFTMIEHADSILNKVLCPKENRSFLIKHPLFSQINMTKAKIFNKQSKHDLALSELDLLEKTVKVLTAPHQLLANLLQEKAEVLFCQGSILQFQGLMLKAIEQRQNIMGKFNIHNAISFSKLSMYSRLLGDEDDARRYHSQALQIFSKFSSDHPNTWIIHLSNASVYLKQKSEESINDQLQLCLKIAEMRYSPDHINLAKIQLQAAKLMKEIKRKRQALAIYESVDKNLSKQLKMSSYCLQLLKDSDDEKISIKKDLSKDIKDIYNEIRGTQLESIINFQSFNNNNVTLQCILEEQKLQSLKSSL